MSTTKHEECKSINGKIDNLLLKAVIREENSFNVQLQPCVPRFVEIGVNTHGPLTVEKACQTTGICNYELQGEGKEIIVTPCLPELRKYQWSFNISDSQLTTHRFEEKYSSVMTVWEIKVRLRHLENVDIEPPNQTLIYRGRLLNNDELLKDIIVNDGRDIIMHLIDTSPICRVDVDEMLEYQDNMSLNLDFTSESDIETPMDM